MVGDKTCITCEDICQTLRLDRARHAFPLSPRDLLSFKEKNKDEGESESKRNLKMGRTVQQVNVLARGPFTFTVFKIAADREGVQQLHC